MKYPCQKCRITNLGIDVLLKITSKIIIIPIMNKKMRCKSLFRLAGPAWSIMTASILVLGMAACSVYEQSVRSAFDQAVSAAVEKELSNVFAGYTDVMMYQLVYTQTFFLGGYGFSHQAFEEGQGATWRVESTDREDEISYTAERALLKKQDDGSSWWYLKFDADEAEPIEYEVLLTSDLQPREMYIRDPDTRDIRFHQFSYTEAERSEVEESEESLEGIGYQTHHFFVESWDDYRTESETITIGAGTFATELLLFSSRDYEGYEDEDINHVEYRWWVSQNVPGELAKFEYRDLETDHVLRGELIELRDNYRPRFADL